MGADVSDIQEHLAFQFNTLRLKEMIDMKTGSAQGEKSIVKKAADKVVNTIVQTAAKRSGK